MSLTKAFDYGHDQLVWTPTESKVKSYKKLIHCEKGNTKIKSTLLIGLIVLSVGMAGLFLAGLIDTALFIPFLLTVYFFIIGLYANYVI